MPSLAGKTTAVAPTDLALFHRNPRRGDTAAIASSLRRHTQYKPITANIGTHTGRPNEVLAGNHTLMAFRDLAAAEPDDPAWRKILVHWVDVDDDMADRIVVADNRLSELGHTDTETLLGLLSDLPDLEGTGFSDDYLKMLEELVEGPPSLDDLANEHGDPEPDDGHDRVRLVLDPEVARRWTAWRNDFADDTTALAALLDAPTEAQ